MAPTGSLDNDVMALITYVGKLAREANVTYEASILTSMPCLAPRKCALKAEFFVRWIPDPPMFDRLEAF